MNKKTIPRQYPIPRTDDLLEKMKGSQYFTVLDLKNGYFQISLKEGGEGKTAFVVPWGKFEWTRMPQGLIGSPYTFGGNIASIFMGMESFVAAYFDDLAIHSATEEEHLQHIETVLEKLASHGLRLNLAKCQWMERHVQFLGHTISGVGIRHLASKITEIVNIVTPGGVDQQRAFLGLCAYYRRFVKNFSEIAAPLYDLFKKNHKFVWCIDCDNAFRQLKESLSSSVVLGFPDFKKPFIIQTDASNSAIGIVLGQEFDGILQPLKYGGRSLTETERRYCTTDKELLSVFYAAKQCQIYVMGYQFIVYIDHKPLIYLKSFRDIVARRFRWIQYFEELQVKIAYIEGRENIIADYLSRHIKDREEWSAIPFNSLELTELLCSINDLIALQREDGELSKLFDYMEGRNHNKDIIDVKYRRFWIVFKLRQGY